jgi:hypothetical protein
MVPVTIDGCPKREAALPRLDEIIARTGVSAEIDLRRIAAPPEQSVDRPPSYANRQDP